MSRLAWALLLVALGCTSAPAGPPGGGDRTGDHAPYVAPAALEARVQAGELTDAVFAGGCFWCMEGPFEALPGVAAVISGYSGGAEVAPSYEDVGSGRTGHAEAVRVIYDPKQVTYERLLEVYWRNIDPTQAGGQFCDRGSQYRSAIFVRGDAERAAAERSRAALKLPAPVVTEIVPAAPFYAAEVYHQDFHRKNPAHYQSYRRGCGRDRRLEQLWGPAAAH